MKKGVFYQSLNKEGGVLFNLRMKKGVFYQSLNEEGGALSISE